MTKEVSVLSDLRIAGALVMDKNETAFIVNPRLGTLMVKDYCLYAYLDISGLETWFPLTRAGSSIYVHTQGASATVWTINHNLNTTNLWYQIQDANGNIVGAASASNISANTLQLNFNEAFTGTVVIVGANDIDVPVIHAQLIQIGSSVTIDTSGMYINGLPVITGTNLTIGDGVNTRISYTDQQRLDIAAGTGVELDYNDTLKKITINAPGASMTPAAVDAKIAIETTRAQNAENTLNTDLIDEINRATNAEATINTNLALKANKNGDIAEDFAINDLNVSGNILPTGTLQDIGSPTQRFRSIYVDEAHLSVNTLYIGDTPILGTNADTINIHSNANQSIDIHTTGNGTTILSSERGVVVSTSGLSSDVVIQATGAGSQARIASTTAVQLTAPETNVSGNQTVAGGHTVVGNLTVGGTVTLNGSVFTVNSTTVTTTDNIIEINKGQVGSGVSATYAGISVDRGDEPAYRMVFDETDDMFKVGMVGQLQTIASQDYVQSISAPAVHVHDAATTSVSGFMSSVDKLKLDAVEANAYTNAQIDASLAAVGAAAYPATNPNGYTANSTDAQLRDRATHTGTQAAATIVESATQVFVTPAEKADITHLNRAALDLVSGSNTGDETITTIKAKLGISTLSGSNTGDQTTITGNAGSATVLQTARSIAGSVFDGSVDISITHDNLSGVGTNTHAQIDLALARLANTSGNNTGDETASGIRTKLGITTLSGSNTGDQTSVSGNAGTATVLQTARTIAGVSFNGGTDIAIPYANLTGLPTLGTAAAKNVPVTGNASVTEVVYGTDTRLTDARAANGGNAATVTTNANLNGEVTSVGNTTTVTNAAVIGKVLTGFSSLAGTVAATDTILQAVNKLNGNIALKANALNPVFTGRGSITGAGDYLPASTTMAAASGLTSGLDVTSQGTAGTAGAAFMTFRRPGAYAVHVGLDTDNFFKIGGYSAGAVSYKIWHEGVDGAGSGLDADLLDGQQGSYYQPAIGTISGLVKGNGANTLTAAVAGVDYTAGTSALATGILKNTTGTGARTIAVASDFPVLNQNTTGNAATATTTPLVSVDNTLTYGRSGLQFVNVNNLSGNNPAITQTPNANWWHILRTNHANATGYYTDLALPMTGADPVTFRRISAGVSGGWISLIDSTTIGSQSVASAATASSVPFSGVTSKPTTLAGYGITDGASNGTVNNVTTTSATAVANGIYVLTNVAATTVTLPATPAENTLVTIVVANSLTTNVIARNGSTIMGLAENMTINSSNVTVILRYLQGSWRIM